MMTDTFALLAALLAFQAAGTPAQQPPPAACPAKPAALPAALAGWTKRAPLTAASAPAELGRATLTIGNAVDATLLPTARMAYPLPPAKPGGAASAGGLFAFSITTAGTYRVALGAGAWIDVVQGGKEIASTAHGHGPACSGIRKIVDFPLTPGRYILQIAGNATPALSLMVVRA